MTPPKLATCFSEKSCKIDKRAGWLWKDFIGERSHRLQLRLFRLWDKQNALPHWHYLIVYDDKFEEFCETAKAGKLDSWDLYGHMVFSGYGKTPPAEIRRLFCEFGPKPVDFPDNEPAIPGSHVHL